MTTSVLPDVGIELREGYAEIGDVNLHYVEAGEGPLIVLLHGFPEFWFGWRQQIEPLAAAGFRVVAPDTRGYNLSSKPEGFEAYAVDLLRPTVNPSPQATRTCGGRAKYFALGRDRAKEAAMSFASRRRPISDTVESTAGRSSLERIVVREREGGNRCAECGSS
jgi:pimeloyl-ACP methyl ester carboxylesterase